jgi:hypothetical protein
MDKRIGWRVTGVIGGSTPDDGRFTVVGDYPDFQTANLAAGCWLKATKHADRCVLEPLFEEDTDG